MVNLVVILFLWNIALSLVVHNLLGGLRNHKAAILKLDEALKSYAGGDV